MEEFWEKWRETLLRRLREQGGYVALTRPSPRELEELEKMAEEGLLERVERSGRREYRLKPEPGRVNFRA